MLKPDERTLVRGMVAWMQKEGVAATKTRLVKFLYLSDLHFARHNRGAIITGWQWYVDSFGPIAREAMRVLQDAEVHGWLHVARPAEDSIAKLERDSLAIFYSLPRDEVDAAAGAMPSELVRVKDWIRRFGGSTNTLLRFVYGNTEPMMLAREGDLLDFTTALPPPKPIALPEIPRKAEKRLDEIMAKLRTAYAESRKNAAASPDGPRDEIFAIGIPREDHDARGEVILTFEDDDEE